MKKITIGTETLAAELGQCLLLVRTNLQEQGIHLQGEQFSRGKYTFYTYRLTGTKEQQPDLMEERVAQALAEGVATFLTEVWEREKLREIVANDFYFYASDEVDYLADNGVAMLRELKGEDGRPLRFLHIVLQVKELLKSGAELLIEGLLRFRLQGLEEDLHRVIEQAIDEYLLDLEYQEFVKLLRYFLDVQEPGLPLLHMICADQDTVRLYNAEGRPLRLDDVEGLVQTGPHRELGWQGEETLSVLIGLAPEKLHIHLSDRSAALPPIVETVKKVFEDQAVLCQGCPLCILHEWQEFPSVKND